MKITCLIDSLNSGGAQRQMCMLASLLKKQGCDVEVLTYFPQDFFAPLLKEGGVPWRVIPWKNKLGRIVAIRKALRQAKPDVVIAYLESPSVMAELATIPGRPFKLIVSERNTTLSPNLKNKIHYNLHRLADAVVPNSYSQQKVLEKEAPYIKGKIHTIINCVDLEKYKVAGQTIQNNPRIILVVGNFRRQKNPLGLCEAVRFLKKNKKIVDFEVHWYGHRFFVNGKPSRLSGPYLKLLEKIRKYELDGIVKIFEPVKNIVPVYQNADVLCLPSFFEGCPNVIGEAMACGKPILASNVCDNSHFVKDGENGFLFDPHQPKEIAGAIEGFLTLSNEDQQEMGCRSRKLAEKLLSPDVFIESYCDLIKSVALR